ncbi:MAG TPA: RNA-binding protein [Alphaproteobacteria bacterium]|nr:RNA-binding protein [Alphaproteobacteria bacterium]HAJ48621.1 RNA-binding protein [Alphaproteobacteria bacterium]
MNDAAADEEGALDAGERERSPLRRCIVTGERFPPAAMVRFVLDPSGLLTPDIAQELPGRGAWVCARASVVAQAAKGSFSKAFRTQVPVPDGLVASVEVLMAKRLCGVLGLAKRSGATVLGFTKVEAQLRLDHDLPASLWIARDSGPADRQKLLGLARRHPEDVKISGLLSNSEMSLAFGRENVVHAALKRGGLAARAWADAERLSGFRLLVPEEWALES